MKPEGTEKLKKILRGSAAPCVLAVFLSILLHSMSLPVFTMQGQAAADEYRTEEGLPYLSEMDSYLYCRLTEELAEEGFGAYTLRHDRGADPYISANATGEEGDVVMGLPILGATVYRLISWVPGVTPYGVIFWLAPIVTSLTAIPAYIFVRRRTNRFGGLVAGLLVAVAAPFAAHTHAGFYDTDLGLSLLPCVFLLLFAECLLTRDLRHQILAGLGSGLALCALGTFWRAYYAYFCVGVAAAVCAIFACGVAWFVQRLRKMNPDRPFDFLPALRGLGIGLAAQLLLSLIIRDRELFTDLAGILNDASGSLGNGDRVFPSAARFVGELQPTPVLSNEYSKGMLGRVLDGFAAYADGIVNALGGWTVILFAAAVVGLLVGLCLRAAFVRRDATADSEPSPSENPTDLILTTAFLFVWLFCGLVIMSTGSRFLTIPVLPIGLFCGLGIGRLSARLGHGSDETDNEAAPGESTSEPTDTATKQTPRTAIYIALIAVAVITCAFAIRPEFGTPAACGAAAAALVIGLLLWKFKRAAIINLFAFSLVLSPCMAAFGFAYCAVPDGTDTLADMCACIRENTDEDAVIASWWDYGYFYEYAAERLTLGDGGNFNSEWNYWLGQALMSTDESQAKGLFRMLATGGLDATHLLRDAYGPAGEADKPSDPALALPDHLDNPYGYATTILKQIAALSREEARALMTDGYGIGAELADNVLALTHPDNPRPIYLVLSDDMLRKTGAIATYGLWDFNGDPALPGIWKNMTATKILPATTVTIPMDDSDSKVRVTRDADGRLTAEFVDGSDRVLSAEFRVTTYDPADQSSADSNDTAVLRTDIDSESYSLDPAIPGFRAPRAAYTILLREDSPNVYRCLVCSSQAANTVLIRGFMTRGDNLFYRSTLELPADGGTPEWHEVSVWDLGK
ncbi:MAG: hypothetical protein J5645_09545 [Lachnospiraceae bacterium]|nr:hypothetical protein [Lachnospiraceae bacterium]